MGGGGEFALMKVKIVTGASVGISGQGGGEGLGVSSAEVTVCWKRVNGENCIGDEGGVGKRKRRGI